LDWLGQLRHRVLLRHSGEFCTGELCELRHKLLVGQKVMVSPKLLVSQKVLLSQKLLLSPKIPSAL